MLQSAKLLNIATRSLVSGLTEDSKSKKTQSKSDSSEGTNLLQQLFHRAYAKIKDNMYESHNFYEEVAIGIVRKLKTEWYCLPTNKFNHIIHLLDFNQYGVSSMNTVLFAMPRHDCIFYKNGVVLFVSSTETYHIELSFIKFTFDVFAFARPIVEEINALGDVKFENRCNRYYVHPVIGTEKDTGNVTLKINDRPISSNDDDEGNFQYTILQKVSRVVDVSYTHTRDAYAQSINRNKEVDVFEHLFYPRNIMECRSRALKWFKNKHWYEQRNLQWKLGMMFHGVGGTGKSEFSRAIAKDLKIPIYQYFLNTLSDQEFMNEWEDMSTPCIALFEDFDNVFHLRQAVKPQSALTFDCVLNQISGVNSKSGVLLIITTNDISKVDHAIGVQASEDGLSSRPGRIDIVREFKHMDDECRLGMIKQIVIDWPEAHQHLVEKTKDMTAAQVQETCVQFALSKM